MREHYNLSGLQGEYDRLKDLYGMKVAIVEYTSRRATGGCIVYASHKHSYHIIRISCHMPYEEQIQTLRHEAAHAFCGYAAAHNAWFWATAEKFGCTRRGAPLTEEFKRKREERIRHTYQCPACGHEIATMRRLKGTRYHKACYDKGIKRPLVLWGSHKTLSNSLDSLRYR